MVVVIGNKMTGCVPKKNGGSVGLPLRYERNSSPPVSVSFRGMLHVNGGISRLVLPCLSSPQNGIFLAFSKSA